MTREEKQTTIEELKVKIDNHDFFYFTDSSTLNVADINNFRRQCFQNNIEFHVVKNTLVKKAMEASEKNYEELYEILKGPTAIMFTTTSNAPAKVLKEFREKHDKPVLKAAYIDADIFKGDDQINSLASLKSREELIGDVIGLLQSPAKNVISALRSGGQKLSGILKTLSEKSE